MKIDRRRVVTVFGKFYRSYFYKDDKMIGHSFGPDIGVKTNNSSHFFCPSGTGTLNSGELEAIAKEMNTLEGLTSEEDKLQAESTTK